MPTENELAGSLFDAVEKDDIRVAMSLLSANPKLLDICAKKLDKNPVLIACELRSFCVAEEMARRKPEFASLRNKDICTAMVSASAKEDLQMVKALTNLNPQLCFVEDMRFMIPLQIAVEKGNEELIRTLVSSSPESLHKMTSQQETVFHLAVKNYQVCAFKVLMEEMKKLKQYHLLNRQDHLGNTVLHIATSKKLVEIVELLLQESSSNHFGLQVNSMDQNRSTALDLYYQLTPRDSVVGNIGRILRAANAKEGSSLEQPSATGTLLPQSPRTPKKRTTRRRWTLETRNVLLVVLAMIAGAALTVTCNFPEPLTRNNGVANATYYVASLIYFQLPPGFYLIVFNAASFMASVGTIAVLTWSLPFGAVLLFVAVSISIVFVIVVNYVMPKFSLKVGFSNISSFLLVWILATTFIIFGIVVVSMVKWLISRLFKEHKTTR